MSKRENLFSIKVKHDIKYTTKIFYYQISQNTVEHLSELIGTEGNSVT